MAKNLSSRNRGEQRKNTMLGVVEAWKPQRFIGSTFKEGPAPKHGVVVVVGLKPMLVSEVGVAGEELGRRGGCRGAPHYQAADWAKLCLLASTLRR